MSIISKLRVWFGADTQDIEKGFKKVKDEGNSLNKGFEKLKGTIATAFSITAITAFAKQAWTLAEQQWKAERRLEAGIKATGNALGYSVKQLQDYASELQDSTLFGDEVTLSAMARLVPYTNITGEVFKKTISLAQDLATVMETDLNSAVVKIGKALNVPGVGLDELREAGIAFTAQQIGDIQRLVAEGDRYAAQLMIIEEIYKHVGGAAEEMANDTSVAFDDLIKLRNSWGDFMEEVADGGPLVSVFGKLIKLADVLLTILTLGDMEFGELAAKVASWFVSDEDMQLLEQKKMVSELKEEIESLTDAELAWKLADAEMWTDKDAYYPTNAIALIKEEMAIRQDANAMAERQLKRQAEIEAERLRILEAEKAKIQAVLDMDESTLAALNDKKKALNELIDTTSLLDATTLVMLQNELSGVNEVISSYQQLAETMKNVANFRANSKAITPISIAPEIDAKSQEEIEEWLKDYIQNKLDGIKLDPVKISIEPEIDETDFGSLIGSFANNIGNILGEAVTGSFDGKKLLEPFADMANQFGTMLIALGVAAESVKASLLSFNGWIAIAAGTALVAAASAIKAYAGKAANNLGAAGATTGTSYSTQLTEYRDQKMKIEGVLKADGAELVAVINEVDNLNRYRR